MTVTETMDKKHQEDLQRLRRFRLLDDDFLTKCFEGKPACIQLVLRIVLDKPDLEVVDVRTQVFVEISSTAPFAWMCWQPTAPDKNST